jgi:hypothetical protein
MAVTQAESAMITISIIYSPYVLVSIDWNAKAKSELIRATREIADMGRKARRRKVRAAQKSGHPAA